MKILFKTGIVAILLLCVSYGYMLWNNNRPTAPPSQAEIAEALEKGIQWLEKNQEDLLHSWRAPSLWHFVQQSAEITGDVRLESLFEAYEERYLKDRFALWRPLFYPGSWIPVRYDTIVSLPPYNRHFIYAITCDKDLGQVPEIAAQNDPGFCGNPFLGPACVTHQLMGIRLLQRIECGNMNELNHTAQRLQQRIVRQLKWDPRVVDVYLQRVLMLAESGAKGSIKPVWIRNILNAQRADGGWVNFDPLIPFGDRYFGFNSRGFGTSSANSDFHATAQGVLLLSILQHNVD